MLHQTCQISRTLKRQNTRRHENLMQYHSTTFLLRKLKESQRSRTWTDQSTSHRDREGFAQIVKMAPIQTLDQLSNPLVTSSQLSDFQSFHPSHQTTIYTSSLLTQAAGILLRLPQSVIATAIITLHRYLINASTITTTSLQHSSAASIYLTAKLSFTPISPRSVINVYTYLTSSASPLWTINPNVRPSKFQPDPASYIPSEGDYERKRLTLFETETTILTALGFSTHVSLPHTLALTYLALLRPSPPPHLAKAVLGHLNAALLSPQLLYLTHQPNALAVAAIYLAAREEEVKLVDGNWWEVFDVDREDLGFLVLGMGSLAGFVTDLKNTLTTSNGKAEEAAT